MIKLDFRCAARLLPILPLLLAAVPAAAQTIAVEPVVIQLAPGATTATLTVVNQGEREAAYQLRAFTWNSEEGKDSLAPTDSVVASPPLGTIAPGGRQLVRLVLRTAPQSAETTYRIWLDQIPPPAEPGAVRIALRFSIPVFAEPATRVAPDLKWHLTREGGDTYLVVQNDGSRHQTVRDLALTDADGKALATEGNVSPHVLAGASRRWHIAGAVRGAALRLTAKTDDGSIDQQVAAASPGP